MMAVNRSNNMLHRMRAQLALAVEQQHEARRCHDRAVAACERGRLTIATEWQHAAAHHYDCAAMHLATTARTKALMRHGLRHRGAATPALNRLN
jgi:hypothetical protein